MVAAKTRHPRSHKNEIDAWIERCLTMQRVSRMNRLSWCTAEGELDSMELPADGQSPTSTDIGDRIESAALDLVRLDRYQRRAWSGAKRGHSRLHTYQIVQRPSRCRFVRIAALGGVSSTSRNEGWGSPTVLLWVCLASPGHLNAKTMTRVQCWIAES
jgi:hypothetical protein